MPRTRIKVCGVRDLETALVCAHAGADAVGFVFHPQSSRFIEPEEAADVMLMLPPLLTSVALFVNVSFERYCDLEEVCPTALSQFHGSESVELVDQCGPGIIKAIKYDPKTIEADLREWNDCGGVDAILVDGSSGGEGTTLDWAGLRQAMEAVGYGGEAEFDGQLRPVFLAGGLTPENVGEAIRVVRPYAVDVSSGVESEPGVKDHAKIRVFCDAVRKADRG